MASKFGMREIKIADKPEMLRIRSNELEVIEEQMGIGVFFLLQDRKSLGVRLTKAILFAGLQKDRAKSRTPWTPSIAGDLLDEHLESGGAHQDILGPGFECLLDHFPDLRKAAEEAQANEAAESDENPPKASSPIADS
jgi:hypothetical protein